MVKYDILAENDISIMVAIPHSIDPFSDHVSDLTTICTLWDPWKFISILLGARVRVEGLEEGSRTDDAETRTGGVGRAASVGAGENKFVLMRLSAGT